MSEAVTGVQQRGKEPEVKEVFLFLFQLSEED